MITIMVMHEVEDVDLWLASPRRKALAGPLGVEFSNFIDPLGSKLVGMIVRVPDLATLLANLNSEENISAMEHDRVIRPTIRLLLAQENAQG